MNSLNDSLNYSLNDYLNEHHWLEVGGSGNYLEPEPTAPVPVQNWNRRFQACRDKLGTGTVGNFPGILGSGQHFLTTFFS